MKVFHWSAVNPENPSPVAILFGILPISDGTFILLARSCMISKCFIVNRFSSIHNWVTIHLAIPKNRQCIGSTIRNFVGLKYGSRYISDQRTKVSEADNSYHTDIRNMIFYQYLVFKLVTTKIF